MDRLQGSIYRNSIVEIVEGILKDCPYKVEIDLDDNNGELIKITDKVVSITFCYSYEISEGVLEFSRFTINFHVYAGVSIVGFSALNSVVIKYIQDEFLRLYEQKKQVIQEQIKVKKQDGGFQESFNTLKKSIKSMNEIFDIQDKFFQIIPYLLRKGVEIPVSLSEYNEMMNYLRINESDLYAEMVMDILEADEWVNDLSKAKV